MVIYQNKKRAQQEMIGFVLIVVLVIVGLMIFLVLEVRKPPKIVDNPKLTDLLNAIEQHTSKCIINYDDYIDIEELIVSCYKNRPCSNLDLTVCEQMEKELEGILDSVFKTESIYSGYVFNITILDLEGKGIRALYNKTEGNCTGISTGTKDSIPLVSTKEMIDITLKMCY